MTGSSTTAGQAGQPPSIHDRLAIGLLVALVATAFLTFRDYGITWDEEIQSIYGQKLLAYYGTLFADRSVFSLDNLFYYGGLFEIVATLAVKISPFGVFETRHLLNALVGILGIAGGWRLARAIGGPRAGLIALILIALTPAYYGHSFFNPKDIPFACALIWALFFACRLVGELPDLRLRTVLAFGATLGCALGIRVGGVLVLVYLAICLAAHVAFRVRDGAAIGPVAREAWRTVLRFLPALPVAYLLMTAFWPWSVQAPLNPLDALISFSSMQWPGSVLVDGQWMPPSQLPFYYLPLILAIRLPEVVLAGLAAAVVAAAHAAWKGHNGGNRTLQYVLLTTAILFPIVYCAVLRPNVFHGYRHFLFLVPVIGVAAALGLDRIWVLAARWAPSTRRWVASAFGAAMLMQALIMAGLFPYEYIYYNAFVGGVRGAAGRFETDYWGSSLREATEDLEQFVEKEDGKGGRVAHRYSVAVLCANPLSAAYFFPAFLSKSKQVEGADFVVERSNADCSTPIAGRVIAQVKRAGVVLSTVFDRRQLRSISGR